MNKPTRFAFAALLLILLAVPMASAFAQTGRTITLTESQINSSFRVTNPARRGVSDVSVDLQPGNGVVASTHTLRTRTGTQVYDCTSTWTPNLNNNVLTWVLSSATCNGEPATSTLVSQINASIGSSWRVYWRTQQGGRVQSVTITDTEAVIVTG